ncbi:MAG: SIS domain-containing protein [Halothiobacillaceae bacterium]
MLPIIRQRIREHAILLEKLEKLAPQIDALAATAQATLGTGGKILLCGNGGSAADAQHIAAELVGRFQRDRDGLAAIALTTDTSILTSVGNDYGFEQIFARQVRALARDGDLLIGLSTSGNSANVMAAIDAARGIGCRTFGLLGGDGGLIATRADAGIVIPSRVTARIQEMHILIGHILCELVESPADSSPESS